MYNIWNALAYELTVVLIDYDPRWTNNWLIKLVRSHCLTDWREWKTEQTMKQVDQQIEDLHLAWKQQEQSEFTAPTITELPPDGSRAQELLGGEMRITAPWVQRSQDQE